MVEEKKQQRIAAQKEITWEIIYDQYAVTALSPNKTRHSTEIHYNKVRQDLFTPYWQGIMIAYNLRRFIRYLCNAHQIAT